MPQMTPAQVRLVDPILSDIAHGFRNPDISRVGRVLFPRVPIPVRGAQIIRFGKESFRLYNTRRAPGSNTKRVQYGYSAGPVSLTQEALEGVVADELREEATQVPGVDLARGAVELVQDVFDRAEEYEQARIALDAGQYGVNHKVALSGTDQWTDGASNPGAQIREYGEAIRAATGRRPNRLVLRPADFNALAEHPLLKDRFKYTSADSLTVDMLARFFNVRQVVVGDDVYMADADADAAPFRDIWTASVLAFVPEGAQYNVPSYGYTYHLPGHPLVKQPYYENNVSSWVYPMLYERQVVQTGMGAGFLIQNAS